MSVSTLFGALRSMAAPAAPRRCVQLPRARSATSIADALWRTGEHSACTIRAADLAIAAQPPACGCARCVHEVLREAREEAMQLLRRGALVKGTTSDPRLSYRRGDLVLNCTGDDLQPLAASPALLGVASALNALGAALGSELASRGVVRGLARAQTQVAVFNGRCDMASEEPADEAEAASRAAVGFLRHTDVTPTSPDRALTLICYLNDARWPPERGGQLRLFAAADDSLVAEVPPAGGTVVVARSATDHEVAPTRATRVAVTCWLRHDGGGVA